MSRGKRRHAPHYTDEEHLRLLARLPFYASVRRWFHYARTPSNAKTRTTLVAYRRRRRASQHRHAVSISSYAGIWAATPRAGLAPLAASFHTFDGAVTIVAGASDILSAKNTRAQQHSAGSTARCIALLASATRHHRRAAEYLTPLHARRDCLNITRRCGNKSEKARRCRSGGAGGTPPPPSSSADAVRLCSSLIGALTSAG